MLKMDHDTMMTEHVFSVLSSMKYIADSRGEKFDPEEALEKVGKEWKIDDLKPRILEFYHAIIED